MNVRLRQSQEIRKQELIRNVMVLVATLAVIVLFTVYRSGKRRKRINRLLLEHQQEIKRRSAELQQLNQVKDKFFSIISHDLRSPMNALAGTLSLLERNEITQQEFNELTRTLQTQFNHTRALITNLLDWTLLQMDKMKIQPEEVRLDTMVEESFAAHHNLYPKELALINEIPAGQTMWADPNILRLIIRNLILNAVKFTPQGGTIIVRYDKDGGFDRVSVHDTGIGIPPDALPYIFDRTSAYTTRGTGNEKGTGLGLILCKEFIEKCGGKISVTSEPGKGSTFSFILPRQELKQTI